MKYILFELASRRLQLPLEIVTLLHLRMCRYSRVECKQRGGTFFWYEVVHGAQRILNIAYMCQCRQKFGPATARLATVLKMKPG